MWAFCCRSAASVSRHISYRKHQNAVDTLHLPTTVSQQKNFVTHTPKAKCVPYCNLRRETRKNFVRSLGNFPSAFFSQTLYKPSTSQLCHFSLEDGDKCFTEMLASTSETTRLQNQRQHKHQSPFKFLYQISLNILRAYRADYSTDLHIQLLKSKIVNCTTEIVKIKLNDVTVKLQNVMARTFIVEQSYIRIIINLTN
jgi:hypothetical protein